MADCSPVRVSRVVGRRVSGLNRCSESLHYCQIKMYNVLSYFLYFQWDHTFSTVNTVQSSSLILVLFLLWELFIYFKASEIYISSSPFITGKKQLVYLLFYSLLFKHTFPKYNFQDTFSFWPNFLPLKGFLFLRFPILYLLCFSMEYCHSFHQITK